jgi:hypothetical protein
MATIVVRALVNILIIKKIVKAPNLSVAGKVSDTTLISGCKHKKKSEHKRFRKNTL